MVASDRGLGRLYSLGEEFPMTFLAMLPQSFGCSTSATSSDDEARCDRTGDLLKRPVFLVGSECSGTTLLRLMLDHHPRIAFFFEFQYSVAKMPERTGWPDLTEYCDYLEGDRIFRAARLSVDPTLDYPHLIDSFLRQKRDRDHKDVVGAVVHYDYDRLLRIWPDARFLHIIRDGRDVAQSAMAHGWGGNLYSAAYKWLDAEELWSRFSAELPPDRYHEVRYEDLVRFPEEVLDRICEFIGVPYDRAMFDYLNDSTFSAPSPARLDKWRTALSPYELQLAEARMGDMLVARGYPLSGLPRLKITPTLRRRLWLQNRMACSSFRRRRYGILLWMAKLFSSRLPLRSLDRALQRRIDKIDERFLK